MLMRRYNRQVCRFYNYDPVARTCELNNALPSKSPAHQGDKGTWETWIAVEPQYDNYVYKNAVKKISERFVEKIEFSRRGDK